MTLHLLRLANWLRGAHEWVSVICCDLQQAIAAFTLLLWCALPMWLAHKCARLI
jgi:hypothetical protein